MRVNPINNVNYNTNFKAQITPTPEWNNYLKYIENAPNQQWVTKHKALIEKVTNAVEKNPSDAIVNIDVFYRKGEHFNARGKISSQYGTFIDTEPARDDSGTAPVENIIRRMLNPENRLQMCKLFGACKNVYDVIEQNNWWDEYIHPIWEDIQETFYEETLYKKSADSHFNKVFRDLNPVL